MFGMASGKIKNNLQKAFSICFDPLKDELGNVPVEMQESKVITASLLGVCESYAAAHGIRKHRSVAIITDAVFEEVFRRESTLVQTRVDHWLLENDAEFMQALQHARNQTSKSLDLDWLRTYALNHFEPANNLML